MIKEVIEGGEKIDKELRVGTRKLKDLSEGEFFQRYCARSIKHLIDEINECFDRCSENLMMRTIRSSVQEMIFDVIRDLDEAKIDILHSIIDR